MHNTVDLTHQGAILGVMVLVTKEGMEKLVGEFAAHLTEVRIASPRTVERYLRVMKEFTAFLGDEHGEEPFSLEAVTKADLERFLRGA